MNIILAVDKNADLTQEIDFLQTIDPAQEGPWVIIADEAYDDPKRLSYELKEGTTIVAYKSPTEIGVHKCGSSKDGELKNALNITTSIYAAIQRVSGDMWKYRAQAS